MSNFKADFAARIKSGLSLCWKPSLARSRRPRRSFLRPACLGLASATLSFLQASQCWTTDWWLRIGLPLPECPCMSPPGLLHQHRFPPLLGPSLEWRSPCCAWRCQRYRVFRRCHCRFCRIQRFWLASPQGRVAYPRRSWSSYSSHQRWKCRHLRCRASILDPLTGNRRSSHH